MLGLGMIAGGWSGVGHMLGGARAPWIVAVIVAVAALVIGVVGLIAWLRHSGGGPVAAPPATPQGPGRVCLACGRRYPAEALFCPLDASPLAWAQGAASSARLRCPRCERHYDGAARFCAIDAEALMHVHPAAEEGAEEAGHDESDHRHPVDLSGSAMICPVCAARYQQAAAYCDRDGTRLSPLN